MQVKLVCTDLVALARSRPDRHSGNHTVRRSRRFPSGSFLSVGGGSKAPVRRRLPHRPEAFRMSVLGSISDLGMQSRCLLYANEPNSSASRVASKSAADIASSFDHFVGVGT